jgi:hypothetical protein
VPKGPGHKSEVGLQFSLCDHSSSIEKGDTRSPPSASDQTCPTAWRIMGALNSTRDIPIPMLVQSGNAGTDTTTGEPVIFDASCVYGHNEAE